MYDEKPPSLFELFCWAIALGLLAGMLFVAFHFNPA